MSKRKAHALISKLVRRSRHYWQEWMLDRSPGLRGLRGRALAYLDAAREVKAALK